MFENIIEQAAAVQLRDDILQGRNAPSMLFFGPPEAGKGSTALELSRSLSCEEKREWKCACSSCERHRYLQHDDLLILGKKSFAAEIAACSSVYLKNPSPAGKLLFFRSLRKLQMRFSPVLLEDEPKLAKISSLLLSLDEKLNEFLQQDAQTGENPEKLCASLLKDAFAIIDGGISDNIPVSQIRKASYWCRLAPAGKQKTLIIENAENMRDEARNSLLKLLEEPPPSVSIVLTSQRREAIMPTVLSRLRPYRFIKRSEEGEKEVLRRVFQDTQGERSSISEFLDSFSSGNTDNIVPLAAFFIASIARIAAMSLKKKDAPLPQIINVLGERFAPDAESAGFERTVKIAALVKTLMAKSGNFEDDSFSRFLKISLELTASAARNTGDPSHIEFYDILKKYTGEAAAAVEVLNQSTTIALEAMLFNIVKAITKAGR